MNSLCKVHLTRQFSEKKKNSQEIQKLRHRGSFHDPPKWYSCMLIRSSYSQLNNGACILYQTLHGLLQYMTGSLCKISYRSNNFFYIFGAPEFALALLFVGSVHNKHVHIQDQRHVFLLSTNCVHFFKFHPRTLTHICKTLQVNKVISAPHILSVALKDIPHSHFSIFLFA